MDYPEIGDHRHPRHEGFFDFVRVITIYGTLFFLAAVVAYLVVQAFAEGFYPGVRSFAGALLPVIIGSFVCLARKQSVSAVDALHTGVSFALGVVGGVVVMAVLQVLPHLSSVPVAEIVVSSCFSVLVFSAGSAPSDKPLSMYYGVISGLLLYIILLGFPLLS